MKGRIRLLLLASAVGVGGPLCGAQATAPEAQTAAPEAHAASSWSVVVAGAVDRSLTVDPALMQALPRQTLELRDHGTPAVFQGVWLRDVLEAAGAPLGERLRGKNVAICVRIIARDGYVTVFGLAELDPTFRDKPILLADRRDDELLTSEEGPLRVVVADESRGGRWIRQIERIELVSLSP